MDNNRMLLIRADLFDFLPSPDACHPRTRYIPDGGLLIHEGHIRDRDRFSVLKERYPDVEIADYSGKLAMPGFIDAHIHYPQSPVIASYGKRLIDWLDNYIYPVEQIMEDRDYARETARFFIRELLRNGTTSCVAYATGFPCTASILFEEALRVNMRMATGKVCMDRSVPQKLCDTPEQAREQSRELIEQWQGRGRLHYVITPRFAVTSTFEELEALGRLHALYPETRIQTHIAEDRHEIALIKQLFPQKKDYLQIYEDAGLIGPKTLLGHGNYLSDSELERIAKAGAVITHCPVSNLFMGSGLFDLHRASQKGVKVCIATDVGGGTSFSLLKTLAASYQVQQLLSYSLHPFEAFYRITLGAAQMSGIDQYVGSFEISKEADFVILDTEAIPLQQCRKAYLEQKGRYDCQARLFGLMTTGDDRNVKAVYLMGKLCHKA